MSHTVVVLAVNIGDQAVTLAASRRAVQGKHARHNTAWLMRSCSHLTSLFQHSKNFHDEEDSWAATQSLRVCLVSSLVLLLSQVAGPIMLPGFTAPSAWQHSLSGQ